jgi:hypothetical protein
VDSVSESIRRVGTVADRYDDLLVEQFGGRLYGSREI